MRRLSTTLLIWLSSVLAAAQELPVRLPPVDELSLTPRSDLSTAMMPPSADRPAYLPPRSEIDRQPFLVSEPDGSQVLAWPPQTQPGLLQVASFRKLYIQPHGTDGMGIAAVTLDATLSIPPQPFDGALLLTPLFTVYSLDGPGVIDMPSRLYDGALEFRWLKQVWPNLAVDLAAAPAVFSDFENNRSDQFRVVGRGALLWDLTPTVQLALGAVYLGREDIPALPIAGVTWMPTDRLRFEAIFPRPRALIYVGEFLGRQWWSYAAGELGGNTYDIRRADGTSDRVTYNDLRFTLGLERHLNGRNLGRLEIGYVFDRYLDYESLPDSIDLGSTMMLRGEALH